MDVDPPLLATDLALGELHSIEEQPNDPENLEAQVDLRFDHLLFLLRVIIEFLQIV